MLAILIRLLEELIDIANFGRDVTCPRNIRTGQN